MTPIARGVAQFGSALDWGSRGRWFKSSRPDFYKCGIFKSFLHAWRSICRVSTFDRGDSYNGSHNRYRLQSLVII